MASRDTVRINKIIRPGTHYYSYRDIRNFWAFSVKCSQKLQEKDCPEQNGRDRTLETVIKNLQNSDKNTRTSVNSAGALGSQVCHLCVPQCPAALRAFTGPRRNSFTSCAGHVCRIIFRFCELNLNPLFFLFICIILLYN